MTGRLVVESSIVAPCRAKASRMSGARPPPPPPPSPTATNGGARWGGKASGTATTRRSLCPPSLTNTSPNRGSHPAGATGDGGDGDSDDRRRGLGDGGAGGEAGVSQGGRAVAAASRAATHSSASCLLVAIKVTRDLAAATTTSNVTSSRRVTASTRAHARHRDRHPRCAIVSLPPSSSVTQRVAEEDGWVACRLVRREMRGGMWGVGFFFGSYNSFFT